MARHWLISYKWRWKSLQFYDRSLVIDCPLKPPLSTAYEFCRKDFIKNVLGSTGRIAIGATIPRSYVRVTRTYLQPTASYYGCCDLETPIPLPGAFILTATAVSSSEIDLSWSDAVGPGVMYNIYRSTDPSFSPDSSSLIAGPQINTNYPDTGLDASVTYYYYVIAVNVAGRTISNRADATTDYVLTAPFLTGSSFGGFEIILGWTASTVSLPPPGYLYGIYRSTVSGFVPGPSTLIVNNNNLSYSDNDPSLVPGTTYYYYNIATDSAGHTAQSNKLTITLAAVGTGPSAPSIAATAVSDSEIDLSWSGVSGTAPITYDVYASTDGSFTPSPATLVSSGQSGTSFHHTGLTQNTHWYYYVSSNNAYGSAVSNRADATTFLTAPTAPTLSLTYVSPTELDLSWTPSVGLSVTYTVYRGLTLGFTPGGSGSTTLSTNATSPYKDTTVTNADSTNYFYYVKAVNSGGSALSNEVFNSVSLIPYMNSNTDPSGTASASQNNPIAYAGFSFGTNTTIGTNWQDLGAHSFPETLKYDFGSGVSHAANQWRVWVGLGSGTSTDFQLQGSNDGSTWATLDSETVTGGGNAYYFYTFANTTAYRYYQMNITSFNSPGYVAMCFQIYGA